MLRRDFIKYFHRHLLDTVLGGYSLHIADTYSDISGLSELSWGRNGLVIKILGDKWRLTELDDLKKDKTDEIFTINDALGVETNDPDEMKYLKEQVKSDPFITGDYTSPFELTNQHGKSFQTLLELPAQDFRRHEKIILKNISIYVRRNNHLYTRFCDIERIGGLCERKEVMTPISDYDVIPDTI